MGDAGLPDPLEASSLTDVQPIPPSSTQTSREISVLVTGFGAFKAFTTNPSYLITSRLPEYLDPPVEQRSNPKITSPPSLDPQGPPNGQPYRIKIHAFPTALRVAYAQTSTFVPQLIGRTPTAPSTEPTQSSTAGPTQTDYDYVVHIGMAGGRDSYALETIAHRDHYKIKDVDDRDGFMPGEYVWKREQLPESFEVGWNTADVLARWETFTSKAEDKYEEDQMEKLGYGRTQLKNLELEDVRDKYRAVSMIGKGRRAVVKLSNDAGRFLCEFIMYTSLGARWKEARDSTQSTEPRPEGASTAHSTTTQLQPVRPLKETPMDRVGKIAFLHVPGGTNEHDIARGVRVTEAAILALVSSWEDGYRNTNVGCHQGLKS